MYVQLYRDVVAGQLQTTTITIYDASEGLQVLLSLLRIFDGSAGFWLWVFRVSTHTHTCHDAPFTAVPDFQ